MRLKKYSADGGRRDVFLFQFRHRRQTSGLTACAEYPFARVCHAAEFHRKGRQSPKTATTRSRPPQLRNDHDPAVITEGPASGQAMCSFSNPLEFHLLLLVVSFGTNTSTRVNISPHLFSSTTVSWNPGLQSQLCELTLDARSVRCTCVHVAIVNISAVMDGK